MAPAAAVDLPWAGEGRAAIMAVAFLVAAGADPEGAAMAPVVRAAAVTITAEREMGWLLAESAFFNRPYLSKAFIRAVLPPKAGS